MDLKSFLLNYMKEEGRIATNIKGVYLSLFNHPHDKQLSILHPSICFIVQGKKTIYLGQQEIDYDENNYLIGSVKIPIEFRLWEASPNKPFLGIVIEIDPIMVSELLVEMEKFNYFNDYNTTDRILTASPFDNNLEESLLRLLTTLNDQMNIDVLSNYLKREVFYNILKGKHGYILRNSVLNNSRAHKMVPIIQFIEKNFTKPITISELAKYAGMSNTILHEKFKEVTSMSPIQFVKKLRLLNGHSLLMQGQSPGEAANLSGYNSQSQFCRDFKDLFGLQPKSINSSRVN